MGTLGSDDGGDAQMITYCETIPGRDEFFALFTTTGWNEEEYHLSSDQLYQAINHSWYMVSVYDDGALIGYGRVISDGILHALIVDMIVHPDDQGKGIGRTILSMLVRRCQTFGVKDIQLFCATGKSPFYEKSGFEARPENAPGMQLKIPLESLEEDSDPASTNLASEG
jgi:GNAT superfamily N-acetyltransferase